MRGASYIMNPPKDLKVTEGGQSDSEKVASALVERNAKGQFVKKD